MEVKRTEAKMMKSDRKGEKVVKLEERGSILLVENERDSRVHSVVSNFNNFIESSLWIVIK